MEHRIGLFEESVGSLDPILGAVEDDIVALVMSKLQSLSQEGDRFEVDLERKVREAQETERKLADFALDRASLRRDIVNELLESRSLATHRDLEEYCASILNHIGGTLHPHADGGQVITLSPRATQRLRSKSSTVRGCFDPQEALRYEELQFLAFGNPFIQTLLDVPLSEDVTVTVRVDSSVPAGTWIETWYELESIDVRPRGLFLKHLIGPDLKVHSTFVAAPPLVGKRTVAPMDVPEWAPSALAASEEELRYEYARLREEARATLAQRQEEETVRVQRIFDYRLERLSGLIAEELKWIERAEAGTNERDKRILPARRGKLEKRRETLQQLKADHEADLDRIVVTVQVRGRGIPHFDAGLVQMFGGRS